MWGIAIAIAFNSMALSFGIFARIMAFFTPFTAILLPDLICTIKKKGTAFYLVLGIAVIFFYIIYYQLVLIGGSAQADAWYPYMTR